MADFSKILTVDIEKKKQYLEHLEKMNEKSATIEFYTKALERLDKFEEYKGISAINMSKLDFIEFLTSLNSSSVNSLGSYKSAINNYLIFATDKQKFTIGLLELNNVTFEDLKYCVNEKKEALQFVTIKDYEEILKEEGNWQDKLVIVLLWNKIKGERNFDEILNLKISDVDFLNKTINVNGKTVYIKEDYEMNVIKKAIDEKSYIRTTMDKKGGITKSIMDYQDGEYLVKATFGTNNKDTGNNQCNYGTFANRMSKYYNIVLKRSGLTNKRVYKSSVYYHMLNEFGRKVGLKEITDYLEERNEIVPLSNYYREQDVMFDKMQEQGLI